MNGQNRNHTPEAKSIGTEAYRLAAELYPICRSITGNGVRDSLGILSQRIPLQIREVPTGTPVFDWTVPKEWNIKDAYVKDPHGKKIIDFKDSNLHVVNYSIPVHETIPLDQLKEHLHTLSDHPDWIPYKTSYYKESWGFCLSHRQFLTLGEGDYEVFIDSELEEGHLTYGELFIPGQLQDEILVSCHICHPSLCNDNLSGVSLATLLGERLLAQPNRYSYRIIFIPGTIGAITWLAMNREAAARIRHGLVISGVGDSGGFSYKKSRRGNAQVDRAFAHILHHSGQEFALHAFSPYGYDERQYCSPGFNLPVGRLSRTPFREYPEYHTSADNLAFISPEKLEETFGVVWDVFRLLENNGLYVTRNPYCEPQLGKRGLYDTIGDNEMAMLWVLNLSDGEHTLLDIAEESGLSFDRVQQAAELLVEHSLIEKHDEFQVTINATRT